MGGSHRVCGVIVGFLFGSWTVFGVFRLPSVDRSCLVLISSVSGALAGADANPMRGMAFTTRDKRSPRLAVHPYPPGGRT